MDDRTKRIILAIIFIVIAVAAGFGIWWFFFRPVFYPPAPPTTPADVVTPGTGLQPALPAEPRLPIATPTEPVSPSPSPIAAGGLTAVNSLIPAPILAPFLAADGSALQYYNRHDGKFYRIRPDGSTELLSDRVFFNVSEVSWDPNHQQAILEYPDGSNITYNFQTKQQTTLPRHWQEFSFSNKSNNIAFLSVGVDNDSRWLAVSSPDGSGSKAIEPLGDNASKVQVAWSPNNQIIAFSRTGSPQSFNEQEILPIGTKGENFRSLIVNGLGFRGKWSPDGQKILYSTSSGNDDWKPQIWIVNGTPGQMGANKTPLGLNTWADKCTFASNTAIYCAVPVNLPTGAGLYPAAVMNTPDHIWRINLNTGQRRRIAIPSEDYTIDNLVVSEDEQYLYLTDKISGQLYKVNLK